MTTDPKKCAVPSCDNDRLPRDSYCVTHRREYNRRWKRTQRRAGIARLERWEREA